MPDDRLDGQQSPHSVEAEQAVLGGLMLAEDAFDRVSDIISDGDFYVGAHRELYRHMRGLLAAGKPVDAVTLLTSLQAADLTDKVGGAEYVGTLLTQTPTAANIRHYAQVVRDRSVVRQLMTFAADVGALAADSRFRPGAELVDEVQRRALALAETHVSGDAILIGDVLADVVNRIEARANSDGALPGLSTGVSDLDRELNGLQDGDLVIVAGRPSMGKTSLAMQFALATAMAGKPALVFSLEMTPKKLAQRAIAHVGHVNAFAMSSGKMLNEDWEKLSAGVGRLRELPLYIDGSARLNVERMRSRARQMKRRHGLAIIVVDYLQLMDGQGDNRNEQITGITRGLKLLANEMQVPLVLLSQLNRKCEERTDKRPLMSDLRDSGAVEQDADTILFVYRDEVYHPDNEDTKARAEIIIGKQRDGATGRVYCTFLGQFNRFGNTEWRPKFQGRAMRRPPGDLDE